MRERLILLGTALLFTIGCNGDTPTIRFIFPKGFNGLVLVSEDKNKGLDLPNLNGERIIEILESRPVAQYRGGERIPDQTTTNNTEDALFGLPSVPGRGCYYFLGTKTDYDVISKMYDFEKLPLGRKIGPPALK